MDKVVTSKCLHVTPKGVWKFGKFSPKSPVWRLYIYLPLKYLCSGGWKHGMRPFDLHLYFHKWGPSGPHTDCWARILLSGTGIVQTTTCHEDLAHSLVNAVHHMVGLWGHKFGSEMRSSRVSAYISVSGTFLVKFRAYMGAMMRRTKRDPVPHTAQSRIRGSVSRKIGGTKIWERNVRRCFAQSPLIFFEPQKHFLSNLCFLDLSKMVQFEWSKILQFDL